MTKTCGKCGHAALDDQAQFCNRCGAAVPEERKPAFPVCPECGMVVPDELAQFCNRCGVKIHKAPITCSSCGSRAIDNQSRFCTRCGTTFEEKPVPHNMNCPSCGAPDPQGQSVFCNRCGMPFNRRGVQAGTQTVQTPVRITQRKPAPPTVAVTVPDTDWEPWNDVPAGSGLPAAATHAIPEPTTPHDQQTGVPEKRYAHLPLIADEMKIKGDAKVHPHGPDIPGTTQKKKTGSQKKGVLGFLKK